MDFTTNKKHRILLEYNIIIYESKIKHELPQYFNLVSSYTIVPDYRILIDFRVGNFNFRNWARSFKTNDVVS